MTNFDFLKNDPQFKTFADVAISAEKILNIDMGASVLNCRRAMEFAVKWMCGQFSCQTISGHAGQFDEYGRI